MNRSKKLEEKIGITLIALIVTVIVMLIIAGVAISAIVGGDRLFDRTRQTAKSYEEASIDEGDKIQNMINQIDEYIKESEIDVYDKNQTYDGEAKGVYSNPVIPKGFAPVNENDAIWGSEEGYQKGLVIQDKMGNEFVWVPVDEINVTFERQDWRNSEGVLLTYPENRTVGDDLETQFTETLPEIISTSVATYGGFYIARYEAGELVNGKTVSKQGVYPLESISWYEAKNLSEAMYPENDTNYGAVSTLIYGSQWDTALKFIGAYGGDTEYAINSEGKGNYGLTGEINEEAATCGLLPEFSQKNIYDMAGNVSERTMDESSRTYYSPSRYVVARGGNCRNSTSEAPAGYRLGNYISEHGYSVCVFRVALYIK